MFIDVNGKINANSAFNDIPNNSAKDPAHDRHADGKKKIKKLKNEGGEKKEKIKCKILSGYTPALELPRLAPPGPLSGDLFRPRCRALERAFFG